MVYHTILYYATIYCKILTSGLVCQWTHFQHLSSTFLQLSSPAGATVVLTDLPVAVPQLQSNVSDNMPASGWPSTPPRVLPLSWGEDHNNFTSDWDLVLGADIVYLRDTFPLLIETLSHLCKNGAAVYLSSKMRKEHDCPRFFEEVLPRRFNVELLHRDEKQNINIYRAFLKRDQWELDQPSSGLGLHREIITMILLLLFSKSFLKKI